MSLCWRPFYILYCLFYVPLFLLRLSIVYLPLFLYQSFYLISPPPINPLPLSFARSPSSFLSHRAVSLSLSLTLSLSFSLSLSLSLWMVRLFCGFDFLSDFLPLELLQSSLSPSTSLPHPLPLSLSLSLSYLALALPLAHSRTLSLALSNVRQRSRVRLFTHPHIHTRMHSLNQIYLRTNPPSFLLQVCTLNLRLARPS